MKSITITILLATITLQSFAGGAHVPDKVKRHMSAMYPNVQADWKKHHGYEADFKMDNKNTAVTFNRKGNVRFIREDINIANSTEAPVSVYNSLNNYFLSKGYKIEHADYSWSKHGGESYEVIVNRDGWERYGIRFDPDGNIIGRFSVNTQPKTKLPYFRTAY